MVIYGAAKSCIVLRLTSKIVSKIMSRGGRTSWSSRGGNGEFSGAMKGDMRGARPLSLELMGRLGRGPLAQPFADPAIGSSSAGRKTLGQDG